MSLNVAGQLEYGQTCSFDGNLPANVQDALNMQSCLALNASDVNLPNKRAVDIEAVNPTDPNTETIAELAQMHPCRHQCHSFAYKYYVLKVSNTTS